MNPISRREFLRMAPAAVTTAGVGSRSLSYRGSRFDLGQGRGGTSLALRGLAVDAARLPERPAYYRSLIDFCREWGLNALLFRLTDDQGSMLRFRSHPELITHRHALTPEEARDLAEYGERQGVTVIPEIESFGHSRYITAVPKYAHLADHRPGDDQDFTGLVPVDPETLAVVGDLYREVAGIFPSPYLHGGCDEASWGGAAPSRRALERKSRAEIWAEYLNALDALCRKVGKELIVWGDFVAHKRPSVLSRLSKRVIVMDWDDYLSEPHRAAERAQTIMDHGLRVIGSPSLICCEWGPRPGEEQLRNIDAYADAYRGLKSSRSLGVIVANWVPSRYLQRSLWDGFAYTAVALNRGSEVARRSAFAGFVEKFYGTAWNSKWQDAFGLYYRIAPNRRFRAAGWPGPRLPVPWASGADLLGALDRDPKKGPPFEALRALAASIEPLVRRNGADFSAFALSIDYLGHLYGRDATAREAAGARHGRAAEALIRKVADRDRSLLAKLDADWAVGRFMDSAGRLEPLIGLQPADQLLFRMREAADFSGALAADGDGLARLFRRRSLVIASKLRGSSLGGAPLRDYRSWSRGSP